MSVMIPIWEEEQAPRLGAPAREDRRFGLGLGGLGRRLPMREELVYGHGVDQSDDEDDEEEQEISSPLPSPSSFDVEEEEEEHDEGQQVPGSSGSSSAAAEPLGSLASLEDSLPTKRGLSGFYSGKSKSFATLADVVTRPTDISASDLAKPENPFNKRRRVRIMARMRRRACSSSNLPSLLMMRRGMSCGALADADEEDEEEEEEHRRLFPPRQELRVLHEDEEHDEDSDDDEERQGSRGEGSRSPLGPLGFHRAGSGRQLQIGSSTGGERSFRSNRSFSLTDLHQHHQQHAAAAEFA